VHRLARLLHYQEAILGQVWKLGGHLYTVDAGEILPDDPDDPMRTAMRQMVGVFNQLDRAMLVKRMRNGRTAKAGQGGYAGCGSPPYGQRSDGGHLVPDGREQAALGRLRELRDAGLSYRQVADTLNAEGHAPKRGPAWHPETVRRASARV